jgi:hypothetical protein
MAAGPQYLKNGLNFGKYDGRMLRLTVLAATALCAIFSSVASASAQPAAPLTWSVQNGSLLVNSERRRDFSFACQMQSAPGAAGPWSAADASEVILSEDDTNWLVQTSIPMTGTSGFFRLQATLPLPGSQISQPPNLIEGVKFKPLDDEFSNSVSPQFDTGAIDGPNPTNLLTYAQAASGLASNGINTVVLKFETADDLPSGVNAAQRDAEIIAMITALRSVDPNFRVYLWERRWLQQGGSSNGGGTKFINGMSSIINQIHAAGVDDVLKGICLIENNLENTTDVLAHAVGIVQGINANTGNWLTNKSFFMPGAGMGAYFVGIDTAQPNFFSQMSQQVGYFAFTFKFFKSQPTDKCSLGALNAAWDANLGSGSPTSQVAWLRSAMGVADLENYINANRTAYPNLANVIYWGDSGDGLIVMSQTNIQAVHSLLVEDNGWTGSFIDMAYCALSATGNDRTKYALTVDPVTHAIVRNVANNDKHTMPVWNEWQRWNWISPGY